MQKILSVLIPTYNNNESLKKVLDSYVGDKRIKILVSDDSDCLLYTSPSPRDNGRSRMPSSA